MCLRKKKKRSPRIIQHIFTKGFSLQGLCCTADGFINGEYKRHCGQRECGFNTGDAIVFCSVLVIYSDYYKKKRVEKPLSNLIFGSTGNDLVRTPHYSYWKESTSLLFQSSLERHGILSIL